MTDAEYWKIDSTNTYYYLKKANDYKKNKDWNKYLIYLVQCCNYSNEQAQKIYLNIRWGYLNDKLEYNDELINYFKKSSDMELSYSMNHLGYMYGNGRGVPKNSMKCKLLYKKSADAGNVMAIFNLGLIYIIGRGVDRNYTKAMDLFQKASDIGNIYATNRLADMYYSGDEVTINYIKAGELYLKSNNKNEFINCMKNIADRNDYNSEDIKTLKNIIGDDKINEMYDGEIPIFIKLLHDALKQSDVFVLQI